MAKTKKKLKIMIVDDNQDIAKLFSRLVDCLGHESVFCHDGHTALKTFESFLPDVAILDIGMPEMNGYELAKKIRTLADSLGQKVNLIAVTGYGQNDDLKKSKAAGFDRHIVKPMSLAMLTTALDEI